MFGNINPSPRKRKPVEPCNVMRELFQKPMQLDNIGTQTKADDFIVRFLCFYNALLQT
jgi:hypothetical protein